LIAGLIAAVVVFVAVRGSDDDDSVGAVPTGGSAAVVAAQDISAGTEITAEMVEVKTVPDDLLISGVYDDTDVVVGDVAKVAIAQGEQINSDKLGLLVPDGLTGVLAPGQRAMAIEVDQATAVGGLLLPGDHVDIIATYVVDVAPGLGDDFDILRTETILQDIEVLSVAQEAQEPVAQGESSSTADEQQSEDYISGEIPDDVEEQPDASTITVALSSQQVQFLVEKQQHAKRIWASVRPFGDRSTVDLPVSEIMISEEDDTKVIR
jgi:Flp pilus assembly protein CpaB